MQEPQHIAATDGMGKVNKSPRNVSPTGEQSQRRNCKKIDPEEPTRLSSGAKPETRRVDRSAATRLVRLHGE